MSPHEPHRRSFQFERPEWNSIALETSSPEYQNEDNIYWTTELSTEWPEESNRTVHKPGCPKFEPKTRMTNLYGFITTPGIENIDPFLFLLRCFGFDLWMSRSVEIGSGSQKRNLLTKCLFYIAVLSINCQIFIHISLILHIFLARKKDFFNLLDDIRTFILKFTMAIAVDLWFLR